MAAAGLLAIPLAMSGCSDDGLAGANDGLGGTTGDNAGGSTSSSISTSMTASATNATTGQAGDDGTGTDPSGPPTASTSGVADSGDSTGGPAGESDGTGGDSGGGSTGDSGNPLGPECMIDADCMVVEDCCECGSLPAGEVPAVCNQQMCDQSACGEQGIDSPQAQCTFGHCELVPQNCNDIFVFCATPPPACPMGTLPGVDDTQNCWSGECVAVENCDAVPDCTYCGMDETCVFTATQIGPSYACVPTSDDCGAVPDCACMGEVCQMPFQCGPGMGAAPLECFCPVCDGP